MRPNTYVCLHSGWVGVARCLRNQKITEKISSEKEHLENERRKNLSNFKSQTFVQKMHDIKIKNIFLYHILLFEVALTSEVNMASKVNVKIKGQELRVENHTVFFLMWSEKKCLQWVGFWKNYVIFKVGHRKWLRPLTRWVGGLKKGQKYAYVIFEWSLIILLSVEFVIRVFH